LPPIVDLDDEMQVILLDRVVDEDEPALLLALAEGPLESAQSARSPQARQTSSNPPHDVDRAAHLGPRLVRNSRTPTRHRLTRRQKCHAPASDERLPRKRQSELT